MKSIVFTHKGKREVNQDYILAQNINPETQLFLVADGMGGYEQGEIAARLVAENVLAFLSTVKIIDAVQIQKAINKANLAVRQHKEKIKAKIGATVGGIILKSNEAICFWVGDVKIFHFRKNKLEFESKAHSFVNEVLKNGSIVNPDQIEKYKHIVTRSIHGKVEQSQVDFHVIDSLGDEDTFIICSDGVHDIIGGIHIQYLLRNSHNLNDAVKKIENQLQSEATDNFSMIAI